LPSGWSFLGRFLNCPSLQRLLQCHQSAILATIL